MMRGPPQVSSRLPRDTGLSSKYSRGAQRGDAFGPAMFCLPVTAAGDYVGSGGMQAAGGILRIHTSTRYLPGRWEWCTSLAKELTARGMHLDPSMPAALTPKGYVPTLEYTSRLAGVGACIADKGRGKGSWVPVGTTEFAIKSAVRIVRDAGGGGTTRADAATRVGFTSGQLHRHRPYGVANGVGRAGGEPRASLPA